MLFCGIGETAINALLAALNLPSVTPTTLKRREREAGVAFEAVADATCQNAILNEKNRHVYLCEMILNFPKYY